MADETTPMTSPGSRHDPSSRHGRFMPGAMFGKRYRIVGLLGRGGMGEVYRADDLELGQTVALKLLPRGLAGDDVALDLLRNEVRVARQVSHPNVCRVYDIGEVEGQYFVSMEYVDGEDLASLLRRIGRLSGEKGGDIVVQMAAGLAAAHQLGVLHRDLKPANIMIDGHGRVRIMDFGLAGFAAELHGTKEVAGTLSYMAPEQLAGRGASARSDVYALGLVIYEILTGRRAYEADDPERLRRAQVEAPPPLPSSMVSDLDPAVERVVMWCLEADPARRPSSAQAVAQALPGGDPLAAALAAGETPSPEMVAAAGGRGGMRPVTGAALLACIVVGLLVIAGLNNRAALFRLAGLERPPVVLADQARRTLSRLGLEGEPGGQAYGLVVDGGVLRNIERTDSTPERWQNLRGTPYSVYNFWYRESPVPLVPYDTEEAKITHNDPPMLTPGMAYARLAMDGRLLAFEAVPDPVAGWTGDPASVDWSGLFEEAGIDPDSLRPVGTAGIEISDAGRKWQGPVLSPGVPVDHMEAWKGLSPRDKADSVRVRAGSFQARPVFFATEVIYGGTRDSRAAGARHDSTLVLEEPGQEEASASGFGAGVDIGTGAGPSGGSRGSAAYSAGVVAGVVVGLVTLALVLVVLIGGPFMAWRNIRMGRGDRRGALRFALFALTLVLAKNLLLADHAVLVEHHTVNIGYEFTMLLAKFGTAILYGAYVGLAYLALEPYVRRHWPDALISWTRLLRGKAGDPLVGRDVLLGGVVGVVVSLIWLMRYLAPGWFGWVPPRPFGGEIGAIEGGAAAVATFLSPGFLLPSMLGVLALVVLVIVLRRRWLGVTVLVVLVVAIGTLIELDSPGSWADSRLTTMTGLSAIGILLVMLFIRAGLLALTVAFFFFSRIRAFPLTLDASAWYSGTSALVMLALIGIAVYAMSSALRGYFKTSRTVSETGAPDLPPR